MDSKLLLLTRTLCIGFCCVLILAAKPVDQSLASAKHKAEPARTIKTTTTSGNAVTDLKTTASSTTPDNVTPSHLSQDAIDAITTQSAPAASYNIPWQSVNGGGAPSSSTNYSVNASVGQSAIGYATSTNYQAGIGYWYGSNAATSCDCPFQCDFDENGFLDANDLNSLIDALFFGGVNPQDPLCPTTRGDFDVSGFPDAIDLNDLIDHLFFGGPPPVDPCS